MEKEEEEVFEQSFWIEVRSALDRFPKENNPEAHKKLTSRIRLSYPSRRLGREFRYPDKMHENVGKAIDEKLQ